MIWGGVSCLAQHFFESFQNLSEGETDFALIEIYRDQCLNSLQLVEVQLLFL